MAPTPVRSFRQTQPITTTLKNICESYPAETCPRELLQNADDAGATEIEFVLVTKSYSKDELLHERLGEYQGPALLVRNNSVFQEKDFESLARVGDSFKRHDATATGKFGRGFNSVYHWTDGPQILSQDTFLILDPHQHWSMDVGQPGGPAYKLDSSLEIGNHLKTFDTFNLDLSERIPQTLIRLPLRTKQQAATSEIVRREVACEEIKEALEGFAQEMRDGGLLFLKYIKKVSLRLDDTVFAQSEASEGEMASIHHRDELPNHFLRLYGASVPDKQQDTVKLAFQLNVEHLLESSLTSNQYMVQHIMRKSTGNGQLDAWAKEEKLFPWVAIAAPLISDPSTEVFNGRLFSTLQLPIPTKHPVHIHGLWSITPDRRCLVSAGRTSKRDDFAVTWNKYMFTHCVPEAWSSVLAHLGVQSWHEERSNLWPRINESPLDIWDALDEAVMDDTIKRNLAVWNSFDRRLTINEGFFAEASGAHQKYIGALEKVQMPVIHLARPLLELLERRVALARRSVQPLSPTSARLFLRSRDLSTCLQEDLAMLLEYSLSDALNGKSTGAARAALYEDLYSIPIWPTSDGEFVAIETSDLFVPRDQGEVHLFSEARKAQTLHVDSLPAAVLKSLREDIVHVSSATMIRYRQLEDLAIDWDDMYPTNGTSDAQHLITRPDDAQSLSILRNTWDWIAARYEEEKSLPSLLDGLYLFPVNGKRLRRLTPISVDLPFLVSLKLNTIHTILEELILRDSNGAPAMLDIGFLSTRTAKVIRKITKADTRFQSAHIEDLDSFTAWLYAGRALLKMASETQIIVIRDHLSTLIRSQKGAIKSTIKATIIEHLRALPIFSLIIAPGKQYTTVKSSLDLKGHVIEAPQGLPIVRGIPDVSFFDLLDPSERNIVTFFDLVEKFPPEKLMKDYLLPWVLCAADEQLAKSKREVVDYIFSNSWRSSQAWLANLAQQPIIPLSSANGSCPRYGCLIDLIDPSSPMLAKLYFEDENVLPEQRFFEAYKLTLYACDLKQHPTWDTPYHRARQYATRNADPRAVEGKFKSLTELSVQSGLIMSQPAISELRTLSWVPAVSARGGLTLKSPRDCRDYRDRLLVDYVLSTPTFTVSDEWRKLLGWNKCIGIDTLLQQLDFGLAHKERDRVWAVLRYLFDNYEPAQYIDSLNNKPCILGSHGSFLPPRRVFFPGRLVASFPMAPYLDTVDAQFKRHHSNLITALNVRDKPSLNDLLEVQEGIMTSNPGSLGDGHLKTIISLLEIVTQLPSPDGFAQIKVPDTKAVLRSLSDVVHGDVYSNVIPGFNYVHSCISPNLITRLEIDDCRERALKLKMQISDEDDDEYTPREQLATIISDALGRYAIRSTFNEFLANAEDCNATKISWVLDPCSQGYHASERTLSKELTTLQGPGLFVHNDSVFSEKDFTGFKEIGKGSKGNDVTSTGMFGRGALSLYHFTDVPMLVSGKWFLIIDPQQELLPRNKLRRRKVGMRISLEILSGSCPDQLAPFHGLFGFKEKMHSYEGTIFRLPFRASAQTTLKEIPEVIDFSATERLLGAYYENARMALLFLRNIKLIDFSVRGEDKPRWSISAERSTEFEQEVFWRLFLNTTNAATGPRQEKWWIGLEDIQDCPSEIHNPGRGAGKVTECGVAACVSHTDVQHKIFCKLPTPDPSHLPISIHASFAITADRQTIPFKDTNEDLKMNQWNRWLLTQCIPELYIEMLKEMTPRFGDWTFDYWPYLNISGSKTDMARLIAKAFWAKLSNPQYKPYGLYPTISPKASRVSENPLIRRPGGIKRLQPFTNFESAHFDFLADEDSQLLRSLLCEVFPHLVRPPFRLWTQLKDLKPAIVEHRPICEWLREVGNADHLATQYLANMDNQSKAKALEVLLRFLVDGAVKDDLAVLYGCKIIPLLDGSLGTLQQSSGLQAETYYTITELERNLFAFASKFLVDNRILGDVNTANPLSVLITSSLFNLRALKTGDVGTLLSRLPFNMSYTELDSWTGRFWNYLNQRLRAAVQANPANSLSPTTEVLLSKCSLDTHPIYRAWIGKQWKYITPVSFDKEAYIVEPQEGDHQALCRSISGLGLVDRECIPYLLRESEVDLNSSKSFFRLVRALEPLTEVSKESLRTKLDRELSPQAFKTLRGLFLTHVRAQGINPQSKMVLRSFAVWRRLECQANKSLSPYIPAEGAVFCQARRLLIPWLSGLENYVDPADVLTYRNILEPLGIRFVSMTDIWNLLQPNLPVCITDIDMKLYCDFLQELQKEGFKISKAVIVPNGTGTLCTADTLYDYNEEIFLAAFRNLAKSHFVHPKFRHLRDFWISLGLKVRAASRQMSLENYSACVSAIDLRQKATFQDPAFLEDAGVVAGYLEWDQLSLRDWPQHSWAQLCSVRMFSVKANVLDQPWYRQQRMHELAVEEPLRSVREVAQEAYRAIVWSQSTFLAKPPATFVFTKIWNGGSPSISQVIKHIKYLISICNQVYTGEFAKYLKDVKDSYTYLQDNASSTKAIPNIKDEAIWLNVDTTELEAITATEFASALVPAKLLCLNSPVDPEPIKVARKFLVPYETLLRELGCPTVVERKIEIQYNGHNTTDPFAVAMVNMLQLRNEGQLIDVVFKAEGQAKPAHKICLAAVSEYCRTQFSGEWGKLTDCGASIELQDMSFSTLSHMIDFAYTGQVAWPKLEDLPNRDQIAKIANNLDELLDLLDGANRWFMLRLHTITEVFLLDNLSVYMRIDNVKDVFERAKEARAKRLSSECTWYIENNSQLLEIWENSQTVEDGE